MEAVKPKNKRKTKLVNRADLSEVSTPITSPEKPVLKNRRISHEVPLPERVNQCNSTPENSQPRISAGSASVNSFQANNIGPSKSSTKPGDSSQNTSKERPRSQQNSHKIAHPYATTKLRDGQETRITGLRTQPDTLNNQPETITRSQAAFKAESQAWAERKSAEKLEAERERVREELGSQQRTAESRWKNARAQEQLKNAYVTFYEQEATEKLKKKEKEEKKNLETQRLNQMFADQDGYAMRQNDCSDDGIGSHAKETEITKTNVPNWAVETEELKSDSFLEINGESVNIASLEGKRSIHPTVLVHQMKTVLDQLNNECQYQSVSMLPLNMCHKPVMCSIYGTQRSTAVVELPWEVQKLPLEAIVQQKSDVYLGAIYADKRWSSFQVIPRTGCITVLGVSTKRLSKGSLKDGIQTLKEALMLACPHVTWSVTCSPPTLEKPKDHDSGINALLEIEKSVTGTIPKGVSSLIDYRQKLKWDIIRKHDESSKEGKSTATTASTGLHIPGSSTDNRENISNDVGDQIATKEEKLNARIAELENKLRQYEQNEDFVEELPDYTEGLRILEGIRSASCYDETLIAAKYFTLRDGKLHCTLCEKHTAKIRPINPDQAWHDKLDLGALKSKLKEHLHSAKHCVSAEMEGEAKIPGKADNAAKDGIKNYPGDTEDLMQDFPVLKRLDSEYLVCDACFNPTSDSRIGKFADPSKSKTSQDWTNRRRTLTDHLQSEMHRRHSEKTLPLEEFQVGMNLNRSAYHITKYTLGYQSFESSLALDAAKCLPVGEKNHSAKFVSSMVPHYANILRSRLKDMLKKPLKATGQPPPFAIIADKYTPNKDSLHIIGIIVPRNGKLIDFLLDARQVEGCDGLSLAKGIMTSLQDYFTVEEIRNRCVGGAFDGQYFTLNIPKHLMDLQGVDEENRSNYSFSWDTAHLIELAGKASRDQKGSGGISNIQVAWIRNVVSVVQEVGSRFKWGKKWRELNNEFEKSKTETETDENLPHHVLRFKQWSTTRFSAYFYDFLRSFQNNYPMIYDLIARNDENELRKISNTDFLLGLNFLADMYNQVQIISKITQKVSILPWQLDEVVNKLITKLEGIEATLTEESFWPVNENLSSFNSCCNELLAYGTYKGRKVAGSPRARVLRNNLHASEEDRSESKIDNCRPQLAAHAKLFREALSRKYAENRPEAMKKLSSIFGIKNILSADGEAPEALAILHKEMRTRGILPPEFKIPALIQQYKRFTEDVKKSFPAEETEQSREDLFESETQFFTEILNKECVYPELANIIAYAIARSSCESVTESMGSKIGNILHGREQLSTAHLNAEAFVVHNGPPSGPQCNKLLEDSLDERCGGRSRWNFMRKTSKHPTSNVRVSKVIDRRNDLESKISFSDAED